MSTPAAARPPTPAFRLPNLIAIGSGKGGVGKTFISISLAQALARQGGRVLLFDGDLGLANVDVQLGISPQQDLGGVVTGALPMEAAITPCPSAGFDILAGRSGSSMMAGLTPTQLQALRGGLTDLCGRYDRVLIDLGAGIDRQVLFLAGPAALQLVVTTDEPTALTDAYALIKTTLARTPDADIRLVVNQADTPADGRRTHAAIAEVCRKFLRHELPLAGIIRRDPRVRDAIRAQMPLLSRAPQAPAAEDVLALAAGIVPYV